jgi:hypothetical protein
MSPSTGFISLEPSSSAKAEDLVPSREIRACAGMTAAVALARNKPDKG